ncbi:MAG TPA: hypothetical protein VFB12_11520 [Ktedonobacteraceae bacterium]|nr:hypothetical protein [Ktedonobacteraceae bacterium]
MTLPTPDAQFERSMPQRPQMVPPPHSMSVLPPGSPHITLPTTPSPSRGRANEEDHEHAIDFATHSWDLATGGLKTLTAKRELPRRPDRRSSTMVPDILATSRSYMFALVIMVCAVLMLVGGGIVLLVMLQP